MQVVNDSYGTPIKVVSVNEFTQESLQAAQDLEIDMTPIEGTSVEVPSSDLGQQPHILTVPLTVPLPPPVSSSGYHAQETTETIVAIADPTSDSKSKLVSLIHPVSEEEQQEVVVAVSQADTITPAEVISQSDMLSDSDVMAHGQVISDSDIISQPDTHILVSQAQDVDQSEEQTFETWLDADGNQETYVSVTDPTTNQEIFVAVQPSNLETLLETSDGHATTVDGTPLTEGAYVTVETPVGQITGDESIVTVSSGDFPENQELMETHLEPKESSLDAVAETVEIQEMLLQ